MKNSSGILISILILIAITPVSAQNNTLYLMHPVPQANQLNPALKGPCRIYISLPVISSVRLSVRNTGFGFHDVFFSGIGAQSENYYIDRNKLDSRLRRINYALINTDVDLLGVGFPVKDWYITIGISSHSSTQVSYPHDIIYFNDANLDAASGIFKAVTIRNLDFNSTTWNSVGISVSKEVISGLRIGARIKYINGMVNLHTGKSLLNLNSISDPPVLSAGVNYEVHSSVPLQVESSPGGQVNTISFKPALHNMAANYLFTGNHGAAIDGGLTFNIDDLTQISASFTDLGFIIWRDNVNTFFVDKTYQFSQGDISRFIIGPKQTDLITAFADSTSSFVNKSNAPGSYITALPLNLFGGITSEISAVLRAGAMTWVEINSGHIRSSLTFSLNYSPFKAFAAAISYSLMNNKFNQIGTGLIFGKKGIQFYIITDNIPVRYTKINTPSIFARDQNAGESFTIPYNARMLSLRFGMNLIIGCGSKNNSKATYPGNTHHGPKSRSKDNCAAYW